MSIYLAILSSFFALSSKIYAQNCGGNFTQYQVLSRNNGENFRQFGDINGDGLTDLITQDNGTVARFYLNTGTGYTAAGSLQLPSFGNVVAAKDFDNDGRVDLLSNSITGTNCLSNQIRIFWNTDQNNAFFSTGLSTNLPLPVNPYCMQSQDIDFNGDGLLDIIATSMPFSPSTNSPGRTYLNNGNRNFSVAADFLWPRDLYGTHTRDFNGDGNADFLVTIKDGWADGLRGMYYYRGNGNGTFQAPILNFNSAPLAAGGIPIQADPLNNNTEDVLMSLNGVSPATIKLGKWNGGNNFAFSDISIPTGFATSQAFDFDLDGKQDIMILSTNGQNILGWMTGNGNGTYTSNASNILQSNEHNLGTLFKDVNSNTQYISGSNPNTLIVYRRNVAQTSFITENITACGSYNWNGNSYTQSGSYNETLFTNVNGCDSIVSTLNLTIIAETPQPPTACYQTATFNNQTCSWDVTGSPAPAIETNASACGSYTWEVNGQSYTASGNFTFSQNCQDYTLNLTIKQATTSSVIAAITQGESHNFNDQNLTAAGTYSATLQNAAGCDSLVTLNLTVEPAVNQINCNINSSDSEICLGENVTLSMEVSGQSSSQLLNTNEFNVVGTYNGKTYLVTNNSMTWNDAKAYAENLNFSGSSLAVFETLEENNEVYALTNQYSEWLWIGLFQDLSSPQYSEPNGGWTWVNGDPINYSNFQPGEPSNGLSIENHGQLRRYPNGKWNDFDANGATKAIIEIDEIQNESYLWNTGETTQTISITPSSSSTYSCVYTLGTQTCTNEVTITVNQPSSETVNASITEGETYNFNGQNLAAAGTYTATLQNAAGCDSVVTLNLTVNPAPEAGCYATSVMNFVQGQRADATNVMAIRSNAELALGMPEPVVTNVVNFVSLGFGGSITLAFEAPIANGEGNDILINEATWGNNSCNNYPETADVFASQDGVNFIYLSRVCQDAELDLGALSWAQYIRIVDVSNQISFNADADGFDVNGITCLNGAATSLPDDGLVACSLQEIVSYTPENRKNGTAVGAPRNNPVNALGTPQNNNTINFTALGFGGTMVAKFDYVVFNQPGNDLRVTETSFGNPSCNNYPEKARVSVSMDNVNWTELGEICQDGEIDLGNVNYAQYIKIQDASPISSNKFNGAADGYDVDAVMVLNNGCGTSSARLAQLDNTTTPDASMSISAFPNPMEDYTIVNFEGLENDAEFTFQIMDAAGRVIRNNNIRVSTANPTYLFDASELARGIYQVVIANDNGGQIIRLVK